MRLQQLAPAPALALCAMFATSPFPARAAAAFPPGLYSELGKVDDVRECAQTKHVEPAAFARTAFGIAITQLGSGTTLYRAEAQDPCLCGAANCLLVALVESGPGAYRRVFSDYTIGVRFAADGTAVADSHSSAAVSVRTSYRYDGTAYRVVRSEYVYLPTGETKPLSVPVKFAAGSSSAQVSGKVYLGFGDTYELDASAGQTMSVVVTARSGRVGDLLIIAPGTSTHFLTDGSALSWTGRLPASGRYTIEVDGAGERPARYAMTIAIR